LHIIEALIIDGREGMGNVRRENLQQILMFRNYLWAFFKFVSLLVPLAWGVYWKLYITRDFSYVNDIFTLQISTLTSCGGLIYFFAENANKCRNANMGSDDLKKAKKWLKYRSYTGLGLCVLAALVVMTDLIKKPSETIPSIYYGFSIFVVLALLLILLENLWIRKYRLMVSAPSASSRATAKLPRIPAPK